MWSESSAIGVSSDSIFCDVDIITEKRVSTFQAAWKLKIAFHGFKIL